jgi:acetate kinase
MAGADQEKRNPVLSLNCGSSTVKFALFRGGEDAPCLHGVAEQLGTGAAAMRWTRAAEQPGESLAGDSHEAAITRIAALLAGDSTTLLGIGHRVVHGGELFKQPVRITAAVLEEIDRLADLAPLHNPANARGIRLLARHFPTTPQVAVFDTAFHQTMPPKAFHYALPHELYAQHRVRRYGFHGTSHEFVAREAALCLKRPLEELQLITIHLGNGCSACAIRHGRSMDTTMGLTPSEGMMMGTRSGDVDPALHQVLARLTGRSLDDLTELLNRQSGLLGVSGLSNDRRVLEARMNEGDPRATLALELFCHRAARAILGLTTALERVDALVFTGGIGENSAFIRRRIVEQMPLLGVSLDVAANAAHGTATGGKISRDAGPGCLVLATNEELAIARAVRELLA